MAILIRSTMLIFALLLGGTGCAGEQEQPKSPRAAQTSRASVDWSGNWDTYWQDGSARLVLEQSGQTVTGSYRLLNGKVTGRVDGRRLTGKWSRGRKSGDFVFVLSEDGSSFMGRYGSDEWWTGARVVERDDAYEHIRRDSPRATLRSFLVAMSQGVNGDLESLGAALTTLDLTGAIQGNEALRVEQSKLFYRVISLFTLQLLDVPDDTAQRTITLTLREPDAKRTFDLVLRRGASGWAIVVPPTDTLQAFLDQWKEAVGGRLERVYHFGDLDSPRATLKTFLIGMYENPDNPKVALTALNTSRLGNIARAQEDLLLATYLRQVLDRISYVIWQEIPNGPNRAAPYVHFRHPAGNVVIGPVQAEDGTITWQFTPETLETIRALYVALENIPRLAGAADAEELPSYFRVRNMLRSSAPNLLHPLGALERWQWYGLGVMILVALLLALGGSALAAKLVQRARASQGPASEPSSTNPWIWAVAVFLFSVTLYISPKLLGLSGSFATVIGGFATVLMVISGLVIVWKSITAIGEVMLSRGTLPRHQHVLVGLLTGLVKALAVVAAVFILAEAFSLSYTSVLAGLGVGGIALALAAQSSIANVLAGFTIYADRPISVGQFCKVGEHLGTIEHIGLRSTRVRSIDRTVITVPNSELVNLSLENYAHRDRILFTMMLQLRYETTPNQLRHVLTELRRLLEANPRVADEDMRVRFINLGESSLDIEIYAYVVTTNHATYLEIREAILLQIMNLVADSGSDFAFPTQVTYQAEDRGLNSERARAAEEKGASLPQVG